MAVSIHTRFHESLGKLNKQQLAEFHAWRERATTNGKYPVVEAQFNALEGILKGDTSTHRESIKKDNGRGDNGGQELRESAPDGVGETHPGETHPTLKEAYRLCEQYQKHHKLSEADARRVCGLPSLKREATKLTEKQYRQFALFTLAGKSEREALSLAQDTKFID